MLEGRKWRTHPRDKEGAAAISQAIGISDTLAQLLINRGITEIVEAKRFLYGTYADLGDPFSMNGIKEALEIVLRAVDDGSRIRICGDYDVDGVTSTVLLLKYLRKLGAKADYNIPHRLEEGYGLSVKAVNEAFRDGISLIVTVDCGTSDNEAISKARSLGMKTVIIDHHKISGSLPDADALVNPRNPSCAYDFKSLAGVGVVFKLVQAICRACSIPSPEEDLDIVALGTIADAVPLTGENRILVKDGIKRITTAPIPGISALLEMTARKGASPLTVRDLSCSIIPRINAAGRIMRADRAVELLISENIREAEQIALELDDLNKQRQKIEEHIRKEALEILESDERLRQDRIIVIAREGWHPGVLGITAYRISEIIGKPVFLISLNGESGRGSARTAQNVNLFSIMSSVSDLFLQFGGHYAAGGFSVLRDNIPILADRLQEQPSEETDSPRCDADIEISPGGITIPLVKELKMLEPFGEGNPEPLFLMKGVTFAHIQTVGGNSHLKVILRQGKETVDGIAFRMGKLKDAILRDDLLYDVILTPEIDTYRGTSKVCAKIIDIVYPDSNSHHVLASPEHIFSASDKENEGADCPGGPLIIDSRNVVNKTRYIREILKYSSSTILVARLSQQMKALRQSLDAEGIEVADGQESESRLPGLILTLSGNFKGIEGASDIIFFSPPPAISHFAAPAYRTIRRIHFLFGEDEISFEEKLQTISQPSFETLQSIYSAIDSLRRRGTDVFAPLDVLNLLEDAMIKKITVEMAFRIFLELNLIISNKPGFSLSACQPLTREDVLTSGSYIHFRHQKDSFMRFKELYLNAFDDLRSEICSIIGSA